MPCIFHLIFHLYYYLCGLFILMTRSSWISDSCAARFSQSQNPLYSMDGTFTCPPTFYYALSLKFYLIFYLHFQLPASFTVFPISGWIRESGLVRPSMSQSPSILQSLGCHIFTPTTCSFSCNCTCIFPALIICFDLVCITGYLKVVLSDPAYRKTPLYSTDVAVTCPPTFHLHFHLPASDAQGLDRQVVASLEDARQVHHLRLHRPASSHLPLEGQQKPSPAGRLDCVGLAVYVSFLKMFDV